MDLRSHIAFDSRNGLVSSTCKQCIKYSARGEESVRDGK